MPCAGVTAICGSPACALASSAACSAGSCADQALLDVLVDGVPALVAHVAGVPAGTIALISATGSASPAERATVAIRRPG